MNVPEPLRNADNSDALVRRVEYDDEHGNRDENRTEPETLIAVDFGPDVTSAGEGVTADVIDSRVIVVTATRHLEFELPQSATDVTVRNGVLTIEGDRS
ncbi:hypothetical protein [Halobiforma nitratireducens]|uniref:Hsp20/alpha crystallin family protein n=1 Tax=Halobiforma nitratireducens JCM 10879 TaxID=1227454 RepID=M0M8G5_9EURY|nr:hypothetical protein [Halobiforma nitratireducens]EMA40904.1 hypothetical protein C446_06995 [Halobiforma nitratireducens JCM 10879]